VYTKKWDGGAEEAQKLYGSIALMDYDLRKSISRYDLYAYGSTSVPLPANEQCTVDIFCAQNFNEGYSGYSKETVISQAVATKPGEYFDEEPTDTGKDCVRSIKLTEGCEKVTLFDDDSSGACNPTITSSHRDLNYFGAGYGYGGGSYQCSDSASDDLENDIRKYRVYPKYVDRVAEQEKQEAAQLRNNGVAEETNPDLGSQGLNEDDIQKMQSKPSGSCWMCETPEASRDYGWALQTCWEGAETAQTCKEEELKVTDIDCRCVNFHKTNTQRDATIEQSQTAMATAAGEAAECVTHPWKECANEGGQCSFAGEKRVRMVRHVTMVDGSEEHELLSTEKTITGGTPCTAEVFSDPAPGTYWTKHSAKHCASDKSHEQSYPTKEAAQAACMGYASCFGVYDGNCDNSGSFYLCQQPSTWDVSTADPPSCVFEKDGRPGSGGANAVAKVCEYFEPCKQGGLDGMKDTGLKEGRTSFTDEDFTKQGTLNGLPSSRL
jgi:hypothetical protein